MDARVLTRLTNAGLLAGVGMGVGHLLMPARAGASLLARLAFAASLVGVGALAGWRERRARELDGDDEIRGAQWLWITAGAAGTTGLAWLAYRIAHGQS